ncbi:MAG: DUF1573 domain-containing protein [Bacteroidales bacterium]|nr:DUF1573 domain-containing protein [Lentimicrobiaceae bacterium]MDD5693999.1 DUF1573 domain-containing protein [Bacteroidales bacterium]
MRYLLTSALFLFMLLSLLGCHSKEQRRLPADMIYNPNSAQDTSNRDHLPVISFESDEHDFGRILQGEVVTYAFRFKNTGKTDLLVSSVSTSCGCTVSKYAKDPVRPGGQGVIEVTFNSSGRKGFQNKTITVLTNAQPSKHILNIKAQIEIPENN